MKPVSQVLRLEANICLTVDEAQHGTMLALAQRLQRRYGMTGRNYRGCHSQLASQYAYETKELVMAVDPEDIQEDAVPLESRRILPERFSIPMNPPVEETEEMRQRTLEFLEMLDQRFDSTAYIGETYDAQGNLIVGDNYVVYTPEQRRRFSAQRTATDYQIQNGDNKLSIAIGLSSPPDDESNEAQEARLEETNRLAMQLAAQGKPAIAIEMGLIPPPRVESQPRMVDRAGNLIQEAIDMEL